AALEGEEVEEDAEKVWRPRHRDLRVAADDDGVGVMAGMAPAPHRRLAQHHEAGDLIDEVVHPARAEGGAMAAFMPARIRGGTVEHAIGEKERQAPPAAPEVPGQAAGQA